MATCLSCQDLPFQRQCFDVLTAEDLALSFVVEVEGHCPAQRVQFTALINTATLLTGQRLFPGVICHAFWSGGVLSSSTVHGPSSLGSAMIVHVGKHTDQLLFVVQLVTTIH